MNPRLLVTLLLALAIGGCGAFAIHHPLPTPPERGALLIVQAQLVTPLVRWGKVFARGKTEDAQPPQEGRLADADGARYGGRSLRDGVVVFNVPRAGTYALAGLGFSGTTDSGFVNTQVPSKTVEILEIDPAMLAPYPALTAAVAPGEVRYLGQVTLHYTPSTLRVNAVVNAVEWSAAGERAALESALADVDPESPWHAAIARRIAALPPR